MAYRFDPNFTPQQEYDFVPFQSQRGGLSNFAIGLGGSVVNTAEGLVNAARYLGADGIPQTDWGKQYNEYFGETGYDPKQFQFSDMVNTSSDWWKTGQGARDLGGLVGSIVSLWAPGGVVAKGVGMAGKAAGVSKTMLGTAQALTAGAVAGGSESLVEYGSNRAQAEDLLGQGKSPLTQQEIEQRADENLGFNLGITVGSDMALGALAFAVPGGKVLGKILKEGQGFRNVAKKAVAGGLTEYLQENLQTQSGNYVTGEWERPLSPHNFSPEGLQQTSSVLLPWNQTPEEKLSSALGLISGGFFGGVGGVAQNIANRQPQTETPMATAPIAQAGNVDAAPAVQGTTPQVEIPSVTNPPAITQEAAPTATDTTIPAPAPATQQPASSNIAYKEKQYARATEHSFGVHEFLNTGTMDITDVANKRSTSAKIFTNRETNERFFTLSQPNSDGTITIVLVNADTKQPVFQENIRTRDADHVGTAPQLYNDMKLAEEGVTLDTWQKILMNNGGEVSDVENVRGLLEKLYNHPNITQEMQTDISNALEQDDNAAILRYTTQAVEVSDLEKEDKDYHMSYLKPALEHSSFANEPDRTFKLGIAPQPTQSTATQQPPEVVALDEQQKITDQQKRKGLAEKGAVADVSRTLEWQEQSKPVVSKVDIGTIEDSDKAKLNEKLSQPGFGTWDWGKDIRINQTKDGFIVVDNTKPRGAKNATQKTTSLISAIEAAGKLRVESGKKAYVNDDFYIGKVNGQYQVGHDAVGLQEEKYPTYEAAVKDAQELKKALDRVNKSKQNEEQNFANRSYSAVENTNDEPYIHATPYPGSASENIKRSLGSTKEIVRMSPSKGKKQNFAYRGFLIRETDIDGVFSFTNKQNPNFKPDEDITTGEAESPRTAAQKINDILAEAGVSADNTEVYNPQQDFEALVNSKKSGTAKSGNKVFIEGKYTAIPSSEGKYNLVDAQTNQVVKENTELKDAITEGRRLSGIEVQEKPATLSKDAIKNLIIKSKTEPGLIRIIDKLYASEGFTIQETKSGEWQVKNLGGLGNVEWGGGTYNSVQSAASIIAKVIDRKAIKQPELTVTSSRERLEKLVTKDIAKQKQKAGDISESDARSEITQFAIDDGAIRQERARLQKSATPQQRDALWGRISNKLSKQNRTDVTSIKNWDKVKEKIIDTFSQLTEGELDTLFSGHNTSIEIVNSDMVKQVGTKYGMLTKYIDALTDMLDFVGLFSGNRASDNSPVKTIYINTELVESGEYYAPILLHETGHMIDSLLAESDKNTFNSVLSSIRDTMSPALKARLLKLGYGDVNNMYSGKYNGIDYAVMKKTIDTETSLLDYLRENYGIVSDTYTDKMRLMQLLHDITHMPKIDTARNEAFANLVMLSKPLRDNVFGIYRDMSQPYRYRVEASNNIDKQAGILSKGARLVGRTQAAINELTAPMEQLRKDFSANGSTITTKQAADMAQIIIDDFYTNRIKGKIELEKAWAIILHKANIPAAYSVMNDAMQSFVNVEGLSATKLKEKLDAIVNRPPLENATITGAHAKADMGITAYLFRVPSRIKDEVFKVISTMAEKALKMQERLRAEWKKESRNIWNKVKLNKEDYKSFINARIKADSLNSDIVETYKIDDGKYINITWADFSRRFSDPSKAAQKQSEISKIYKNTLTLQEDEKVRVIGYNDAKTFTNEADAIKAAEADSYTVGRDFGLNETVVEALLENRKLYNKMFKAINAIRKATGLEEVKPLRGYMRHHFDSWIVTLRKSGVYDKGTEVIYKDDQGKTHKVSIVAPVTDGYTVESKSGRRDIPASQITKVLKYPESDSTKPHRFTAQTLGEAMDIAKTEREKLGGDYHIDIRNKFADGMSGIGERSDQIQMDTSLTQEEKDLFANAVALTDKDLDAWLKNPDSPYPKLAEVIKTKTEWTNKELRSVVHGSGAKKEIFRSGIYRFISTKPTIKTEDILTFLDHAGAHNRYLEALQERTGVSGFSEDIERVDNSYIDQATRYIGFQPFKHNAQLWYNRAYETDFYEKAPPTRAAEYAHKYINDVLGVPKPLDNTINQAIKDIPILGKLLQDTFGDRPFGAMVGKANAFTTVTKLALFRASSALLQTSIFININAKLDKAGITRYAGLGPTTRKYIGIALGMGAHMNGKKYNNPRAEEYAEVLRYANLDLDFITMANEGGTSVFGGGTSNNKYMTFAQKFINTSMKPFLFADMLGRRTAMLGFYDQAIAKGMSKTEAMEYAERNMLDTNFNQSVTDAINAYRIPGTLGKLLFQFKQFPIKQLNFIWDLEGAERKQFWTSYMMLAGAMGVPMFDWFKEMFKALFGADIEHEFKRQVIGLTGDSDVGKLIRNQIFYGAFGSVPALVSDSFAVDLHNRVGIPDMFPTRLRDLAGPTLSTGYNVIESMFTGKDANSKLLDVLASISPVFKDYKEAVYGEVRSQYNRDRLVMELDPWQRLARILGFRPVEQSVESDKEKMLMYFEDKRKTENQLAIDKYIRSRDADDLAKLRQLGVTTQQIRDEIKRKATPASERASDSISKKVAPRYADIETM